MSPSLRARPSTGEAPFDTSELFFSRTDPRGVIQAGNSVFQRVADYPWQDMLGAPHKIIRHDDMPRAVFWLLWDTIQKGKPIAGYVKNRARDGLHYWVLAVVTPVPGGYLSVRMKPGSDLFQAVQPEYAALRQWEKAEKPEPAASAARLLGRLAELGFDDYESFMTEALTSELAHRCETMERTHCDTLGAFLRIRDAISGVVSETRDLSEAFESIRGIPYNLRLLASRMEAVGGPISVISANYGLLSNEIGDWMQTFVNDGGGTFGEIRSAVRDALFLKGVASLQDEMCQAFGRESGLPPEVSAHTETGHLHAQAENYAGQSVEGIRRVVARADHFGKSILDMKRLITGLGATRMMCKIEGARLRAGGDSLGGVIDQLDRFQDSIEERLGRIDDLNREIQREAANLVPDSPALAETGS